MLADEEVDAAGDPPDVSMASVDEDILEETNFDEKTLDFFTTKSFDFETLFNKDRKSFQVKIELISINQEKLGLKLVHF